MSKRKQDDSVDSGSEKLPKSVEGDDSSRKGSVFVVTVVNDSIQGMQEWTEEETAQLKEAIDADGGQLNWDVIASAVPSKDINQVKAYVSSIMSQAQQEAQNTQTANVMKAPIEIWTDLAQKLTSDEDRAAAVCMPQVMVSSAVEPINTQDDGSPNYGQIYLYLASLLKGETPAPLPPLESSIVLSLIQQIVNKIRSSELGAQMHFLSTFYKDYTSGVIKATSTEKADATPFSKDNAKRNNDTNKAPGNNLPQNPVKQTSSGRIVRQRFQIIDHSDDENENKTKDKEASTSATSRPTSLNPFRIPVNLLNFKPTYNKKP